MNRAQIEAILGQVFQARLRGDAQGVAKHFSPDATYRMSGTPELGPMTAVCCGRDSIQAAVEGHIAMWDTSACPVVSTHVDGDTAHILLKGPIRHIPSGKTQDFELLDRVTFRNGQIVDFVEFLDTFGAWKVASQPAHKS